MHTSAVAACMVMETSLSGVEMAAFLWCGIFASPCFRSQETAEQQ